MSYDFDGDGVVSSLDYFVGRSFDKDMDGKLTATERRQAERALDAGFLDQYARGFDSQGLRGRSIAPPRRRTAEAAAAGVGARPQPAAAPRPGAAAAEAKAKAKAKAKAQDGAARKTFEGAPAEPRGEGASGAAGSSGAPAPGSFDGIGDVWKLL